MNFRLRHRTCDLEARRRKARRAKADTRIVGKAKAFLWPAKHVPAELHLMVFVGERNDSVVIGRKVGEYNCGFSATLGD